MQASLYIDMYLFIYFFKCSHCASRSASWGFSIFHPWVRSASQRHRFVVFPTFLISIALIIFDSSFTTWLLLATYNIGFGIEFYNSLDHKFSSNFPQEKQIDCLNSREFPSRIHLYAIKHKSQRLLR